MITVSRKILSNITVSNIENNKKSFLFTNSANYNDFWRIM